MSPIEWMIAALVAGLLGITLGGSGEVDAHMEYCFICARVHVHEEYEHGVELED